MWRTSHAAGRWRMTSESALSAVRGLYKRCTRSATRMAQEVRSSNRGLKWNWSTSSKREEGPRPREYYQAWRSAPSRYIPLNIPAILAAPAYLSHSRHLRKVYCKSGNHTWSVVLSEQGAFRAMICLRLHPWDVWKIPAPALDRTSTSPATPRTRQPINHRETSQAPHRSLFIIHIIF